MGKADTVTKKYLRQSSVFADIFNFYLYGGRQVISPGQLRELDPAEFSVPYGADQKGEPVQRYRDLFKACRLWRTNGRPTCSLASSPRNRFTMRPR